jgi:hypothetical protein
MYSFQNLKEKRRSANHVIVIVIVKTIYTYILTNKHYALVITANIKDFMRFNYGQIFAMDRKSIVQIKYLGLSKED